MKTLACVMVVLIALLQYPLWLGKGSWLRVWDTDRKLVQQKANNATLVARNSALEADVRDLKSGFEAIEERARYELGLVKRDEMFFQFHPSVESSSGTPRGRP